MNDLSEVDMWELDMNTLQYRKVTEMYVIQATNILERQTKRYFLRSLDKLIYI